MAIDEEIRLYSVAEVNELIPRLELIMERMQVRAIELRESLEQLAAESGIEPRDLDVDHLLRRWPDKRALVDELQRLAGQIGECGGQFKGLDLGLVDFPAEVEGEIALLCWQYGEKEVSHWHPLDGGFAGRRPLSPASMSYLQ